MQKISKNFGTKIQYFSNGKNHVKFLKFQYAKITIRGNKHFRIVKFPNFPFENFKFFHMEIAY